MTLLPNTIGNQLIEEISLYISEDKTPSTFEVARLKREANKLKTNNRALYAAILGMIACIAKDVDECKKQHELSIAIDCSIRYYADYCTSLYNLGRIRDAYDWARKGLNLFPYAPKLIESAVKNAYFLGLFDKVVEHYQALIPLQMQNIDDQTHYFVNKAKMVLRLGIPGDSLHKLSTVLEDIRLKHDSDIRAMNFSLFDTEENQELFHWIETSSDIDTTVKMNIELCETLASQQDIDIGNMTVIFRACQN